MYGSALQHIYFQILHWRKSFCDLIFILTVYLIIINAPLIPYTTRIPSSDVCINNCIYGYMSYMGIYHIEYIIHNRDRVRWFSIFLYSTHVVHIKYGN